MMFRVGLKDAYMYKMPRLHSTFVFFSVTVHHALFLYVSLVFSLQRFSGFIYLTLPDFTFPCAFFLHFQGDQAGTGRLDE